MKTWFITGASRGFGLRIAQLALKRGDQVVATARDPSSARKQIGDNPRLLVVALDVTREEQVQSAVQAGIDRFGHLDILLNNAGFGLVGAVEEASAAEVEALFRTNVFGLLAVTRAVLPHMRQRGAGRILNISSIGGYRSAAGFGVYCSTKFAVEGLSEALHHELAPLGIQVSVIEPGYFRTDFLDASSLQFSSRLINDYRATAGQVRSRVGGLNHQQPGDPEALAGVIVEFGHTPNPPVRLPLGSDTIAAIEAKHAADSDILVTWRNVAMSTDFTATA